MVSILTCDTGDDVKIKGHQRVRDKGGESIIRWDTTMGLNQCWMVLTYGILL